MQRKIKYKVSYESGQILELGTAEPNLESSYLETKRNVKRNL